MRLVFDSEWDGFKDVATHMWCLVAKDIDKGDIHRSISETPGANAMPHYPMLHEYLSKATVLIGHNIIDYDLPLLEKLYGWTPAPHTLIVDTVILSRLYKSDRARPRVGGDGKPHSLASWGARVGLAKPDHTDWTQYSPEMLERCIYDVEINHLVYNELMKEREESGIDWTDAEETEHEIARRIVEQEVNGVPFNAEEAEVLKGTVQSEIDGIDLRVVPLIPEVPLPKSKQPTWPKSQFKKDGKPTVRALNYYGDDFTEYRTDLIVKTEPINLGSDVQVKNYLLSIGWVPTEWNYKKDPRSGKPVKDQNGNKVKTSPRITEESMESVDWEPGHEHIGEDVLRRHVLAHRNSMLAGFLRDVRPDGRIQAEALPMGTPTSRMTHRKVVNVPGKGAVLGKELRSLFGTAEGYKRVGIDLVSCQVYALCHYMPDEGYREANRTGDSHVYVQEACGIVPTDDSDEAKDVARGKGKKVHYTTLFGAGPPKIAETLGITKLEAKKIKDRFFVNVPQLPALIARLEKEWATNGGWITGLDGRAVWVRAKHMLLNYLLQSMEAIVIKNFINYLLSQCDLRQCDYQLVTTMHDEVQVLVRESHVDGFKSIAHEAIDYVNKKFDLQFNQEIDTSAGETWWDCH